MSSINVIVLDDNEFDQRQLGRVLKSAGIMGDVCYVDNLTDFTRLLKEQMFDLALIDFNLADGTGLDAVQILREQPIDRTVLPIMVAGEARMELAVQAMKDGCTDFLPKQELTAERVRNAILSAMRNAPRNLPRLKRQHTQHDQLLATINELTIGGLRPRLARMLRIIRQAISTPDHELRNVLLQLLDDNCMELSEFCDDVSKDTADTSEHLH